MPSSYKNHTFDDFRLVGGKSREANRFEWYFWLFSTKKNEKKFDRKMIHSIACKHPLKSQANRFNPKPFQSNANTRRIFRIHELITVFFRFNRFNGNMRNKWIFWHHTFFSYLNHVALQSEMGANNFSLFTALSAVHITKIDIFVCTHTHTHTRPRHDIPFFVHHCSTGNEITLTHAVKRIDVLEGNK